MIRRSALLCAVLVCAGLYTGAVDAHILSSGVSDVKKYVMEQHVSIASRKFVNLRPVHEVSSFGKHSQ